MDISSSATLEITVISAEDLRTNRRSVSKNAFVTIETGPNNSQSTNIDTEGGSYPLWNQKLQLSLPYNIKHIRVEAKCRNAAGVKSIGSVSIPISDIFEDYTPPNCLHFLSYRLRDANWEPNGIINFSVLLKGGLDYTRPTHMKVQGNAYHAKPASASQAGGYNYSNNGGAAIGIPMAKGYMY